jgi:hypothetical protein
MLKSRCVMLKIAAMLGLCGLAAAVNTARADASPARFDGVWSTVISCAAAPGALPYRYELSSVVKNNVLRGERGIKGVPGWLQLEGRILADGSARIAARGLVGKERAALGELPAGTPYHYSIDAMFSDASGSGYRVRLRRCTVSFRKNTP